MSEFESFAREWEAHERSRHAELMRDLKREFHVAPKSAAAAKTIAPTYSPLLPPAVPCRQSYSRYPGRGMERSRREVKE